MHNQPINQHHTPFLKIKVMGKYRMREINVKASGNPIWYGGAYSIVFIYSKNHGNLVIKGYHKEVYDYIRKHITGPFFGQTTMWCDGKHRYVYITDSSIKNVSLVEREWGIFEQSYNPHYMKNYREKLRTKFKIKSYLTGDVIYLKRLPKHWIPEFDGLLKLDTD